MKEENIFTYNLFAIKYFRKGHPFPQLFVYCLTRNTLLTFFYSDEQCTLKVKQISSTYCWLVLILLLCVCVSSGAFSHLCHHETTNTFIFVYMQSFLFGLSWHNPVENYRLSLFFGFPVN